MAFWRSAIDRWRKFRRLPGSERLLLLQAAALASLMGLGLRCLGFRRLHAFLTRFTPPVKPSRTHDVVRLGLQARRWASLVETALRWAPSSATCLHRSLTLWWLLRRRGIDGELRIGVRKTSDQLEAHAWVEYQGVVLNDREDVNRAYVPFDRAIEPVGARSG
jgi:hypothetical protein